MPSPFHFARTWNLDVSPDRFWRTISRTGEYRTWWPWLREFDADGFYEGAQWRAVIQSPWRAGGRRFLNSAIFHGPET